MEPNYQRVFLPAQQICRGKKGVVHSPFCAAYRSFPRPTLAAKARVPGFLRTRRFLQKRKRLTFHGTFRLLEPNIGVTLVDGITVVVRANNVFFGESTEFCSCAIQYDPGARSSDFELTSQFVETRLGFFDVRRSRSRKLNQREGEFFLG